MFDALQRWQSRESRNWDIIILHFHFLPAKRLVENRNIKIIGIDTPSIDYGRSSKFMTHRILFEKDIPAFENMAYLDQLPEKGMYIVAFPMKIKGGSGAPLRIGAFVYN